MSSETVDLARRGFLRGNMLTRKGREHERRGREPLGPQLPWFECLETETCGDCAQPCLQACGERILQVHPQNHALAATPWLDFSTSGCNFCGDCARACPALDKPVDTSTRLVPADLDTHRCLAWNGVFCISCIGRCNQQALSLDERRRVHLDASRCNGCGFCVAPCPAGALGVSPSSQAG